MSGNNGNPSETGPKNGKEKDHRSQRASCSWHYLVYTQLCKCCFWVRHLILLQNLDGSSKHTSFSTNWPEVDLWLSVSKTQGKPIGSLLEKIFLLDKMIKLLKEKGFFLLFSSYKDEGGSLLTHPGWQSCGPAPTRVTAPTWPASFKTCFERLLHVSNFSHG